MEERRGESSDVWMKNTGKSKTSSELVLMAEEKRAAIQAAQKDCDAHGIDPTLDPQERVTRLIDIQQGSPLMQEERQRKAAYQGNNFKSHVNNVVKNLPPTVAELQRTKHGY